MTLKRRSVTPQALRALLGLGASYFINVRDPLQEAYEQFATRAEELAA
jgi:hypothetical protein